MKNYYDVLGVDRDASTEEIRIAYKILVKKFHPDVNPEQRDFFEKKSKELNEAYETLSNSSKRASYDIRLDDFLSNRNTNQQNKQKEEENRKREEEDLKNKQEEARKAEKQREEQEGFERKQRQEEKKRKEREEFERKQQILNSNNKNMSNIRIYQAISIVLLGIILFCAMALHFSEEKRGKLYSESYDLKIRNENLDNKYTELEAKNKDMKEVLDVLAKTFPFVIKSIDFRNSADSYNPFEPNDNDYSLSFVGKDIRYIYPRLKIVPLFKESGNLKMNEVELQVKLINPNGVLDRGTGSSKNYTYTEKATIYGTSNIIYLTGWGNEKTNTYAIGQHKIEIYYKGNLLGTGYFNVVN